MKRLLFAVGLNQFETFRSALHQQKVSPDTLRQMYSMCVVHYLRYFPAVSTEHITVMAANGLFFYLLCSSCPCSYDSEGRLTNVTFPTGVVTNLHGDMSSGAVAVDIETSGRDEDVSITTNLSSVDSFYTLVQGRF